LVRVVSFGIENGYFVGDEGFACSPQRAKVTKKARIRAAAHDAEVARVITLDVCPTVADVEQFAAAFEVEYPGYGARLVRLAFATGLRICELLALRLGLDRPGDGCGRCERPARPLPTVAGSKTAEGRQGSDRAALDLLPGRG